MMGYFWFNSAVEKIKNIKLPPLPKLEDTATKWQKFEYNKNSLNFSFEYPSEMDILQVQEEVPQSPVQVSLSPKQTDDYNTLWTIVTDQTGSCKKIGVSDEVLGDIEIGGTTTQKIKSSITGYDGRIYTNISVCLKNNGIIYTLTCNHQKSENYDYSNFYKMISTFKLIK